MKFEEYINQTVESSKLIRTDVEKINAEMHASNIFSGLKKTNHFCPVIENQKIIGIITTSDVDKLREPVTLNEYDKRKRYNKKYNESEILYKEFANEIMSKELITAKINNTIDEIRYIVKKHKKKILPVLDKNGKYQGIIKAQDIIEDFLKKVE